MSEYSIRKLDENDWLIFKQIRLEALATDPFVFGSTHAAESARNDEEWSEPLKSTSGVIFVIFDSRAQVGITGIGVHRDDPSERSALLWGSWLAPEVRGKGLSRMLYESRIDWAREHPTIERIVVSHRASNLASKFANQNFGFVPTHVTEKIWNDGITEEECHYELIL